MKLPEIHKSVTLTLQYLLAIGIIYWIVHKIDLSKIGSVFHESAWWTIPVMVVFAVGIMAIQGVRWWLLLNAFTKEIRLSQALSFHFSSIFYSMVLPTSAAQELLRTFFVSKYAGSGVSWGAAWIGKISALLMSLIFSLFGFLVISSAALPKGTLTGIVVFFLLILSLALFSFSKRVTTPIRLLSAHLLPVAVMRKIETIREGIYLYRNKKAEVALTLLISFGIQLIFSLNMALIIKGVTGHWFFWECLTFAPIIEIISMAQPFTPNGMGVREALSAVMFKYLGLPAEQYAIYMILTLSVNLLKLVGVIPVIHAMMVKKRTAPQS